jgi:hypothetical protein
MVLGVVAVSPERIGHPFRDASAENRDTQLLVWNNV